MIPRFLDVSSGHLSADTWTCHAANEKHDLDVQARFVCQHAAGSPADGVVVTLGGPLADAALVRVASSFEQCRAAPHLSGKESIAGALSAARNGRTNFVLGCRDSPELEEALLVASGEGLSYAVRKHGKDGANELDFYEPDCPWGRAVLECNDHWIPILCMFALRRLEREGRVAQALQLMAFAHDAPRKPIDAA